MEKETIVTPDMENTVSNTAEGVVNPTGEVAEPVAPAIGEDIQTESQGTNATENIDNSASGSRLTVTDNPEEVESKSLKRAEFEKLIKGDYKEFYEERIKENLSRRFKENAELKEKNLRNSRIVEMLCDKYNVDAGDFNALQRAIESDDAYLLTQAQKRGMSIDDYKYIRKLESENKRYRDLSSRYKAEEEANRTVERWYLESQKLKETYPDFNIFEESKNASFVSLIKSGIDVKTAYEAVHHNEIVSKAADEAARNAEIRAAETIKQRAMRPAENGLSSQSSAIIKSDVSKLSASERAEIARRVSRGERITF